MKIIFKRGLTTLVTQKYSTNEVVYDKMVSTFFEIYIYIYSFTTITLNVKIRIRPTSVSITYAQPSTPTPKRNQ